MARSGRPSFLKKQKEQKRLEKAARKREERQARKAQKAEGVPLETADSPEVGADEAPSEEPTQLGG